MDQDRVPRSSGSILYQQILDLMPQFVLHIDPIVHSARFRGMKINDNQVKVMMFLHHAGKVSPGFISHHLNIQKGSLTGVLKSLRRKSLILREEVPDNERTYRVSLTEDGEEFVVYHQAECEKQMSSLLKDMHDDDRYAVCEGLEALTKYLRNRGEPRERP